MTNKVVLIRDSIGNSGGLKVYVLDNGDAFIEPIGNEEDLTQQIQDLAKKDKITRRDVYDMLNSCFIAKKETVIKDLKDAIEILIKENK